MQHRAQFTVEMGGGAHLVFVCLSVCGGTVNKMENGQGRQLVPAFGFHTRLQGLSLGPELASLASSAS